MKSVLGQPCGAREEWPVCAETTGAQLDVLPEASSEERGRLGDHVRGSSSDPIAWDVAVDAIRKLLLRRRLPTSQQFHLPLICCESEIAG